MSSSLNVLKLSDVVELVGYLNPDSSTILKEIIEDYDVHIADDIKNNKVAKIPYIGNVRKNLIKQEFNELRKNLSFKSIRSKSGKELYKVKIKGIYYEAINKVTRRDRLKVLCRFNRASNRALYDRLCATAGKVYANAYIYCLSMMTPVLTSDKNENTNNINFKFKYETRHK